MKPSVLLLALFTAGAAACADADSAPLSPNSTPGEVRIVQSIAPVARGLAGALEDETVRTVVRDAMRASPLERHKLVLQEFAATAEGEQLLSAAAAATGTTVDDLRAQIRLLPPLDLVIPSREHRTTWRGTADVAVIAAAAGNRAGGVGFGRDGREFREGDRQAAGYVALVLQPAGTRSARMYPQPAGRGEVIQDAAEKDIAVWAAVVSPSGEVTEVDPRDPVEVGGAMYTASCSPTMRLCPVDPLTPAYLCNECTFLEQFWTTVDPETFDAGSNNQELEFSTRLYTNAGTLLQSEYRVRFSNVEEFVYYMPEVVIGKYVPNSNTYIRYKVRETNGWLPQDSFQEVNLTTASHNTWIKQVNTAYVYQADPVSFVESLICYGYVNSATNPCPQPDGPTGNPQVM